MIRFSCQDYDNGDKWVVLDGTEKRVTISYKKPFVTIEHFHFEYIEIEDSFGETTRESKKVTDKLEKLEMPFWDALIKETTELEKIEKARKD